jgi:glucan-binding YG repeat protein
MGFKKNLALAMTAGMILTFVPANVMADTAGWKGNYEDGWRYYTSDTDYVKSDWKFIGNKWYYFDADGIALYNTWESIDGKLYHFGTTCAMDQNKWISEGSYLPDEYYEDYCDLNSDYEDVMDEYKDKKIWRYVGNSGAAYTGWRVVNGEWYHFNDEDSECVDISEYHQYAYAAMTYGFYYDENDEAWYNFDGDGLYRKDGWYYGTLEYDQTVWYYFDESGHAYYDWHKINNEWYYFARDTMDYDKWVYGPGCVSTGMRDFYFSYDDDGCAVDWDIYIFTNSGAMVTGWYKYRGEWYYLGSNGSAYKDRWLYSGGNWYYFIRTGEMISDAENFEINGKGYDFDEDGVCTNPDDGRKITGWYERKYDSDCYFWYDGEFAWNYFDESGKKVCDTDNYIIGGKGYDFDTLGICENPYEPHEAE